MRNMASYTSPAILERFHPLVAEWFERRFGTPTEAQVEGWPAIAAGDDTLIAAPTGSGKTLTAFLFCLDRLIRRALDGTLGDETEVLYVSPLKALSNDIEKNLARPLEELYALASERGLLLPSIRVAVRTGDTPSSERQKMARRPPHVLITTPESLYILLTAERSRQALRSVRTLIVDEIHAVAGNKRGAHLALSLARLEALASSRPVRIGLSATQQPIEEVARFLVGTARVDDEGRPACRIVDTMHARRIDLAVEIPEQLELSSVAAGAQWAEVYDRVAALVQAHKSTLVFCNTRRHVERASHALAERLGDEEVAAHHGSLSHKLRRKAEQRLKEGEIRCVVATASLELGIDVGAVDLVVQLGTPRSLSVLVQRIGRSGHVRGGVPKGRLFAMTRDEQLECAALVRAVRGGGLDRVRVRRQPLDVLAQQLVAECAAQEWDEGALFELVRGAWPYRELSRARYDEIVGMLSEGLTLRDGRSGRAGAHLHRDGVHQRLKGRRGARIAAVTSGGAIPDNADYAVIAEPEGVRVGTLDEDFAIESLAGDIFLLGNTSWRIRRVEAGTVRVEDAGGAPPSVPFWNGEAPGRSDAASIALSSLRGELEARLVEAEGEAGAEGGAGSGSATATGGGRWGAIVSWLERECGLPAAGAAQAVAYVDAVRKTLGVVPTQQAIVAERFFDEGGGMQLVLHAPFGARINRAWGLALRKRFCRSFNFELQAAATDDGIVLSLGPTHSFPLESVFQFLAPDALEDILRQAVLQAPMFATRWRWTATRSLALLRMRNGKRVPPQLLRMRADDLLVSVFPNAAACPENLPGGDIEIPRHPLVDETMDDCLVEPLDLEGARALLERITGGQIALHARDTAEASPLSHAIINANPYAYLDDAPLEERRTRAVMMRRTLPDQPGDLAALDAAAIAQVVEEAWPAVRDADELHDLLLTLGALSEGEGRAKGWGALWSELAAARRVVRLEAPPGPAQGTPFWVAAERLERVRAAWVLDAATSDAEGAAGEGRRALVMARMEFMGPVTARELAAQVAISVEDVDVALAGLEGEGLILRGRFRPGASELEWCHRRLLARIHSLTIGRLRREIEPVSAAVLLRFLLRWQHAVPGGQLHGAAGLGEVLGQLQGVDAAAYAWEREILPARVAGYDPDWIDLLCLRGEIAWGRLDLRVREAGAPPSSPSSPSSPASPSSPTSTDGPLYPDTARRSLTRVTPIAILGRADLGWLLREGDEERKAARQRLGPVAARVLDHLALCGASFFGDLVRSSGYMPSEIEDAVGELVASGLITGDGFASLRALLGEARRRPGEAARGAVPARPVSRWGRVSSTRETQVAPGRWSLLLAGEAPAPEEVKAAWARQLLRRYGVVFRDLVQRDAPLPWRELSMVYRQMEARGELRGGRFVAGFVGEQFALPEALESLRAMRREEPAGEEVVLSAADPLNLVGQITPGPRVPAVTGNRLLLRDGVPVASCEAGRLVERAPLSVEERERAERLLLRVEPLPPPPRRAVPLHLTP